MSADFQSALEIVAFRPRRRLQADVTLCRQNAGAHLGFKPGREVA